MLRKLMKHELLATGRIMLPMFALVMLAAVGGNISTYRLLETDNGFFNTVGVLLLTVFIVAIFAACLLAFALMVNRFYQNLLKDEGYLMMTLPVTVHEHVLSKLLVSILWFSLTAVTVVLAFFILIYQAGFIRGFFSEVIEILGALVTEGYGAHSVIFALELLLLAAAGSAMFCLQAYAAIAIGHSFASHKTFFSIGAYFLIQTAMQIVYILLANTAGKTIFHFINNFIESTMVETILADGTTLYMSAPLTVHVILLGAVGVIALHGAAFYAITAYFMKKRLNLN